MKIYRTTTVLTLSTWDEKRKAFIEITPAFEGRGKGQPKPGEKIYDYDKTIRISFQLVDMLTTAYRLIAMAHGKDASFDKFADMSKVANSASMDKKILSVKLGDKGGIYFSLSFGKEKASINLSQEETYAIGKWFEFQAQKFVHIIDNDEEASKLEALKEKKAE